MAFKMVFIDIDGTLLNNHHQITPGTKETIQTLAMQYDIKIVLATARPYYGAWFFRDELGLDTPIVCFNGALIVDHLGTTLVNHTVGEADANIVATSALAHRVNLAFLDKEMAYALKRDYWVTMEEKLTRKEATVLPYENILKAWANRGISGANKLMGMGDPDLIELMEYKLKKDEDLNLTINTSHPSYLEITHVEASKQHAVKYLHELFEVKREEVVAIGDSFNDTEMIKYAGLGVAMGNAHENVQAIANEVAPANEDEGVKAILQKLFL